MNPPHHNEDDDDDDFSCTVQDIFLDYKARRSGIMKALITDIQEFHNQCDPRKRELCLYGLLDGTWEVVQPTEEVPPSLPDPLLGINYQRDIMQKKDWLSLIAAHSDSWLMSVAFYQGIKFGFAKRNRKQLFRLINVLPTVLELTCGKGSYLKFVNRSSRKSKSYSKKRTSEGKQLLRLPKDEDEIPNEQDEDDDDDDENLFCAVCSEYNYNVEFWIGCDVCEKWFHGKCVKITPTMAESIKQYNCPTCSFINRP